MNTIHSIRSFQIPQVAKSATGFVKPLPSFQQEVTPGSTPDYANMNLVSMATELAQLLELQKVQLQEAHKDLKQHSATPVTSPTSFQTPAIAPACIFVPRLDIPADSKRHVLIKNLPAHYTQEMFYELASKFGQVLKLKMVVNMSTGESLGYGFVEYAEESAAQFAINRIAAYSPPASVRPLRAQLAAPPSSAAAKMEVGSNIYVSGLPLDITRVELEHLFGRFGPIMESKIINNNSKPYACGLIRYSNLQHAQFAITTMNGTNITNTQNPSFPSHQLSVKFANQNQSQINSSSSSSSSSPVAAASFAPVVSAPSSSSSSSSCYSLFLPSSFPSFHPFLEPKQQQQEGQQEGQQQGEDEYEPGSQKY